MRPAQRHFFGFLLSSCLGKVVRVYASPQHPFHKLTTVVSQWGEGVSSLLRASFSHHGRPLDPGKMYGNWPELPHYNWRSEAETIVVALCRWFPDAFTDDGEDLPDESLFVHFFAGLAALADWVGSDRRFLGAYQARLTAQLAGCALAEAAFSPRGVQRTVQRSTGGTRRQDTVLILKILE